MTRARAPRHWWVGVDLGGTWLRVAARDSRGRRRSLSTRAPELAELPAALGRLWTRWRLDPRTVRGLAVASRGVWTPAERQRQRRRLHGLAARVLVISDAEAAHHAALGGGPGLLLLAGTGSMALGRDARGEWTRAGGLGPLFGDDGAAFWIGREWLRTATDALAFAAARRMLASPQPAARIAQLAPGVLEQARRGSPRARAIVRRGQAALADLLVQAARGLRTRPPIGVSWGGSLLDVASYRAGVWRAARRRGLDVTPSAPRTTAVEAALRLAESLAPSSGARITRRTGGHGEAQPIRGG